MPIDSQAALVGQRQAKQLTLIVSLPATQASSARLPSSLRHTYSGCDSCSGTVCAAAVAAFAAASAS